MHTYTTHTNYIPDSDGLPDLNDILEECLLDSDTHTSTDDISQHGDLYPGANLNLFTTCLLIFQFTLNHHLSSKAFSELLLLMRVLPPNGNQIPKSIHSLKQFFWECIWVWKWWNVSIVADVTRLSPQSSVETAYVNAAKRNGSLLCLLDLN